MNSIYSIDYREKPHLPVVCAYYDRADMGATTPREVSHLHSLCELMYVCEGEAEVLIHPGIRVPLRRREYIWLDAFAAHRLILRKDRLCSMMNVEFDLLPRGSAPGLSFDSLYQESAALRNMLEHPVPYLVLCDEGDAVYHLLKQIIRQEAGELPGHRARSSMLAAGLILMTAGARHVQGAAEHSAGRQHADRALALIRQRPGEPLTAALIAREMHIHPGYLHKLLRRHTGQTLSSLIRSARMEEARRLLEETQDSVPDIAAVVGIPNRQRFSKLFQEAYGLSPSQYRKSLS